LAELEVQLASSRGGHEVGRHLGERALEMILTPHLEEDRLDLRALRHRLDGFHRRPVRARVLDQRRPRTGLRRDQSSKNTTARSEEKLFRGTRRYLPVTTIPLYLILIFCRPVGICHMGGEQVGAGFPRRARSRRKNLRRLHAIALRRASLCNLRRASAYRSPVRTEGPAWHGSCDWAIRNPNHDDRRPLMARSHGGTRDESDGVAPCHVLSRPG